MEKPEFWRDLREQFRGLGDLVGNLHAIECRDDTWLVCGGPPDEVALRSLQAQFAALATRGAVAASISDGGNPLDAWLNRLKNGPYAAQWQLSYRNADDTADRVIDRIRIENLTMASAELCVELETEVFAQSRVLPAMAVRQRMVGGPNLAAWLREHMDRRKLSDNRVTVLCSMDRKTVMKILDAQQVRSGAIVKLADGLDVDQTSLPRD
jgi:hypothetical protein